MDELAGRYLTLCLRLSRLVPGLVDTYTGPDRLLAAVHSEPRRLPERLAAEADRLAADVATESTLPADRAGWMTAQLIAVGTVGRARAGDVLAFPEHVRHVLGTEDDPNLEERLEDARGRVAELVPGGDHLRIRVQRHLAATTVPPERVLDLFAQAVSALRPVAARTFRLPDEEYVSLREGATDDGRLAQPRPDGHAATKVTVHPRATALVDVLRSAAASTYAGAHTLRVMRTALLVEQFGRGECGLELRWSPSRTAALGTCAVGFDAIVPRHERELLLDRLADAAGIALDAHVEFALAEALADLDEVLPEAARLVQTGDPDHASRWLQRYLLRPNRSVARTLGRLQDRDAAVAVHLRPRGRRAALGFLDKQDDPVDGFRRLVTEQLTPAALLAGR